MKKMFVIFGMLFLLAFLLTGCKAPAAGSAPVTQPADWEGEPPQDVVALLADHGYEAVLTGTEPSILHAPRCHMELNGDRSHAVAVYLYESAEAAQAEAACIGADGYSFTFPTGEDTAQCVEVDWVDAPHFYRDGSRIILYIGQDPVLLDAFAKAWGSPIAGAE